MIFENLSARIGRKKAIIAVARPLLTMTLSLLKDQEPYRKLSGSTTVSAADQNGLTSSRSRPPDMAFPEPIAMPRFAILEHDHPHLHWDLLLACGPVCRTWRLAAPPGERSDIEAEAIADHRQMYLDYEGPVSGNRGCVRQWDAGTYDWLTDSPERIAVQLTGRRWSGRVDVIRINDVWRAEFTPQSTPQARETPA